MNKSVEIDTLFERNSIRIDLNDRGAIVVNVEDGILTIDACNHKTLERKVVHIKLD